MRRLVYICADGTETTNYAVAKEKGIKNRRFEPIENKPTVSADHYEKVNKHFAEVRKKYSKKG